MKYRAFSLLELVMVLILISIMAAIALPRFGSSTARATGKSAADRIAADIAWLQAEALRQQSDLTAVFDVANNNINMTNAGKVKDPDHPNKNYAVKLDEQMPGVSLLSADFEGENKLKLNKWGVPKGGGTVVIGVGNEQWTITVEAETGRVAVSE